MASKDLHNNIKPELVFQLAPVSAGNTIASTAFDTSTFESIEFLVNWVAAAGSVADPDTTVIKLEDTDEIGMSAVWTEVSADFTLGTPLQTGVPDPNNVYRIGYVGKKRYVRIRIIAPTGDQNWTMIIISVKSNARNAPTSAATL